MSSSQRYIDEKLQQHDPDFVLLSRFLGKYRQPLSAVFALWTELQLIPIEVSDTEVALAKLGWWQQEWDRWQNGRARHPITQLLPPASDISLTGSLMVIAELVQQSPIESERDLATLIARWAKPFAQLESAVAAQPLNAESDWHSLTRLRLAEALPAWLAKERAPLPLDWQAELQLGTAELAGDALIAVQNRLAAGSKPGQSIAGACVRVKQRDIKQLARGQAIARRPLRRLFRAWAAARRSYVVSA